MLIRPKEQTSTALSLAAIGKGWELFLPPAEQDQSLADLMETRTALSQAETVIRAQEERIRQLEQMAMTDELTGLPNRRGFMMTLDRELSLARRDANYGGILVMIDLDGFKAINDKWGHQAGDAYLRTVGHVLKEGVRDSDVVARLGGDEFALLLTHMDEDTGAKRIARLEQAFSKRAMMLHERIPLRASFGFAAYEGGSEAARVMQTADIRLYAHKARHQKAIAAD